MSLVQILGAIGVLALLAGLALWVGCLAYVIVAQRSLWRKSK